MNMWISYYILFSLVCVFVFGYSNWEKGNDLTVGTLIAMVIVGFIPVLNLVGLVSFLYEIIEEKNIFSLGSVLIRGRKKNDVI